MQNSLVPVLHIGSHKNRPYKYLIDKTCSFAPPCRSGDKYILTHRFSLLLHRTHRWRRISNPPFLICFRSHLQRQDTPAVIRLWSNQGPLNSSPFNVADCTYLLSWEAPSATISNTLPPPRSIFTSEKTGLPIL